MADEFDIYGFTESKDFNPKDPDSFNDPKNVTKARKAAKGDIAKAAPKTKERITLRDLLNNALQLYGERGQLPKVNVLEKIKPSPGVNIVRIDAVVRGVSKSAYESELFFWDVKFVAGAGNKDFPIPAEIISGGTRKPVTLSDGTPFYMEQIKINSTPTRIYCNCADFQFRSEWYAFKAGILMPGRKVRPYKRKTPRGKGGRPDANPHHTPNLCKHLYALALKLQSQGFIETGKLTPKVVK
tara:strand:+ start:3807 stop:4529 length:723 start_codon:yes stop_codon:yes gene_type:complete